MEVASDLFFRFGTCIRLKWFIGGGGGGGGDAGQGLCSIHTKNIITKNYEVKN